MKHLGKERSESPETCTEQTIGRETEGEDGNDSSPEARL